MISIVIPVFNQAEMTTECLQSIVAYTTGYEVIVVDNGSKPAFCPGEKLTFIENLKILRNDTNLGFPCAVNAGIRASSFDTIVLLNNDVVVTPEWASRIEKALGTYAIVGPMTGYCSGLQQVMVPVYNDEVELNKVARDFAAQNHGKTLEVNWVIGFCMAFKKSLWEEIGPFDESLWPCSGEEITFCLSAREKRYKVGICQDVYIHHYGSQTFVDLQDAGVLKYEEIARRNEVHINKRWPGFWTNQAIRREENC